MGRRGRSLKRAAIWTVLLQALPVGPATADATAPCRIAVLGDSLTAGWGVELGQAFPARLQAALAERGFACTVIDAGVSGDTSSGGRARLGWVLADRPTHLIVELGGNDALRALPVEQLEANLDAIVAEAKAAGVRVLLAGMLAPPNLGRAYGDAFAQAYRTVADRHEVPLYPFFLDGAVTNRDLMQSDGVHPTTQGVAVIVERILPQITAWLAETPPLGSD
jgi:acyl-CoA thioesterase-1